MFWRFSLIITDTWQSRTFSWLFLSFHETFSHPIADTQRCLKKYFANIIHKDLGPRLHEQLLESQYLGRFEIGKERVALRVVELCRRWQQIIGHFTIESAVEWFDLRSKGVVVVDTISWRTLWLMEYRWVEFWMIFFPCTLISDFLFLEWIFQVTPVSWTRCCNA